MICFRFALYCLYFFSNFNFFLCIYRHSPGYCNHRSDFAPVYKTQFAQQSIDSSSSDFSCAVCRREKNTHRYGESFSDGLDFHLHWLQPLSFKIFSMRFVVCTLLKVRNTRDKIYCVYSTIETNLLGYRLMQLTRKSGRCTNVRRFRCVQRTRNTWISGNSFPKCLYCSRMCVCTDSVS